MKGIKMKEYTIVYKTEMGIENEYRTISDSEYQAVKEYENYMENNRAENCEVVEIRVRKI